MAKTLWAVLLAVVVTGHSVGQTVRDGEIAGRITDLQGQALPGVRIAVGSGDGRREAITDDTGRFIVGVLNLGTYRVIAELAGFISASGSITLSPMARRAHLEWHLEIGCISEFQTVMHGSREAAPMADAIVHLRVTSDRGPVLWSTRPECAGDLMQAYSVEVLKIVSARGLKNDGLSEIRMSAHRDRLMSGGEYLALLWPNGLVNGTLIFPIASGRVAAGPGEPLNGMRVEEALDTLGKWSREARR
jgi:hypothetical protein